MIPNAPTRAVCRLAAWLGAFVAVTSAAWAQAVSATIQPDQVTLGEAAQYQLVVQGEGKVEYPTNISVDGLNIAANGQSTSQQWSVINGRMTRTGQLTLSYRVTPQREGTFTIPVQKVRINGQELTSEAVTLTVGGAAQPQPGAGGAAQDSPLAYVEVVVPKESAYVGEVVPAELRVFVDTRVTWQVQNVPKLAGEGFAIHKLTEPTQGTAQRNGRTYDVLTYKTALTPAKTGEVTIGPLQVDIVAQMQQRRRRQTFGFDMFDDVFGDPLGMFMENKLLTLKGDPLKFTVKALPKNAPPSFRGAVGQFKLSTSAQPSKVNLGDPVTLTLSVGGRGNFDHVAAPHLPEQQGWRGYPASGDFKADDNVGISGVKKFEMPVVPEDSVNKLPAIEFTYFDPVAEKYVTLKSEQLPIEVVGQKAPALAQAPAKSAPATTAAAETAPARDIHYLRSTAGAWKRSWEPLYRRPAFVVAQVMPLLALLAFCGWQMHQRRARDVDALTAAEWNREKQAQRKVLRSSGVAGDEFYRAAVRFLQLETALRTQRAPDTVGVDDALASLSLDAETEAAVRAVFESRAELIYAGGSAAGFALDEGERARIVQGLERFEKEGSHA